MQKQELLLKYEETDKILIARLLDKIEFTKQRNTVECTDFLDIHQQQVVLEVLRKLHYNNYILYGSYEMAERMVLVLYPEKLTNLFADNKFNFEQIISVIRIILPGELRGKYNHRDYLGGLMKLGIKREKVGDILPNIDGADIIVKSEIGEYLLTHLKNLTRFSKSDIKKIKLEDVRKVEQNKQLLKIIIPSMRIDSIVSEVIKCSRSKAGEIIKQERVLINHEIVEKNSRTVKENDMITVRGKGRFQIKQIIGSTKKGNTILEVEIYV